MTVITIKKSITIHADALAVFEAITDFEHYSEWNPWVTEAHGRCVEGEVVTATRRWFGIDLAAHHRIVEMQFPEKMRWAATDWYRSLVSIERERLVFPCADGSTLYTVKLVMTGPLARAAGWLATRSMRDGMRAETVALKQWCETHARQHSQGQPPRSKVQKIRSVDLSGEHQIDLALR